MVALFNKKDNLHKVCTDKIKLLNQSTFLTTEAVLTESFYLLSHNEKAVHALQDFISLGHVEPISIISIDFQIQLMRRYEDTPMSYADASLVALASQHSDPIVFTTDSDFHHYRYQVGHQHLPFSVIP